MFHAHFSLFRSRARLSLGHWLACMLSGLALAAAFPKWDQTYLLPVALWPLFYALQDQSPGRAFRLGYVFGLAFYSGLLYWIAYVTHVFGRLPLPLAVAVMLLLAGFLSLYRALWAAGVAWAARRGASPLWVAPALWVALEYLQANFPFGGFPWELLGYGLYRYPMLLQVADLTGVYGLSFMVVLVNVLLFLMTTRRFGPLKHTMRQEALPLLLIMFCVGYGANRLAAVKQMVKSHPQIKVAVTQGNIKQGEKWNPKMVDFTLKRYAELTEKSRGARLIIWPETAAPFFYLRTPDFTAKVQKIAQKSGAYLLFGAPAWELTQKGERYFNRAYLLTPKAEVAGYYDKVHLVPYGEYVPLQRIFFFIPKMVPMIGDFARGRVGATLSLPEGPVGVLICFESIFPYLARAQINNGARLLINITNDAWFGETSAPYQHMSMAVVRAVEGRVAVARAANTGISAFIAPDGRILWTSGLNVAAARTMELPWLPGGSLYTRFGDVFAWVCILLAVVVPLTARRRYS
ncbi:MAG: apolipoprotein N-acyltransferase [Deltaproteobacteria bacterium]|nr:apolipoprotein N-acyltransferase [Deltaproteobacteria bacterium]